MISKTNQPLTIKPHNNKINLLILFQIYENLLQEQLNHNFNSHFSMHTNDTHEYKF